MYLLTIYLSSFVSDLFISSVSGFLAAVSVFLCQWMSAFYGTDLNPLSSVSDRRFDICLYLYSGPAPNGPTILSL